METKVEKVSDFEVTGQGTAPQWQSAEWQALQRLGDGKAAYAARARALYSDTGIYFLFDCPDRKLTCTMTRDFDDIYKEDVVEVFLWPDERQPLYFEYEISPLGVELPILVPNHEGVFMGWRPWHYEGERKIRSATAVRGGPKASMAAVEGWSAEFFVPFALFRGLGNTPPRPGTRWRANMYRIDYDETPATLWAWCPQTGGNFHNFRQFGTFVFRG
jgi:hypothetical protein